MVVFILFFTLDLGLLLKKKRISFKKGEFGWALASPYYLGRKKN
jgi:hypothetical protein